MSQGSILQDPKDCLLQSDKSRLIVKSSGAGFKSALDIAFDGKLAAKAAGSTIAVTLEAYTDNPGEFQTYVYNWSKKDWEEMERVRLDTQQKVLTLRKDASGCVDKDGAVRIKMFRKESRWNGFELGIDRIQIELSQ